MTNIHFKYIYILAIAFLITVGNTSVFAKADRLVAEQWQLTHVNHKAVGETKAYIEINSERTRFAGHTGCNRMFGTVDARGRQMNFSNIGTTKMFCSDVAVNSIEKDLLRILNKVTGYRLNRNRLELLDGGRVVLKFKTNDDVGLDDKKWMLEAVKGKSVSGRGAFVVFDKDKGSAGGNTGCNVFGGSYSTTGNKIAITDTISTMRACEEDGRMSLEREFLDGMQKASRFEIRGNKLTLFQKDSILLTFVGEKK